MIQHDFSLEETPGYRAFHAARVVTKDDNRALKAISGLRAKLPVTVYRQRLGRVNSERLIRWYHDCQEIVSGCRYWLPFASETETRHDLNELRLDALDYMTDIEETFNASRRDENGRPKRGIVWYEDDWCDYDEAQERERQATMPEWERRLEDRRNRFDEGRDER